MKKFLSTHIAVMLVVLGPASAHAADAWVAPDAQTAKVGQSVIDIREPSEGAWDSRREAIKWGVNYGNSESYTCHEVPMAGPCDLAKSGFSIYSANVLAPCETASQEDCIDTITFTGSDGKTATATHIGNAGGPIFPAIPEVGMEAGGQISLWSVDGFPNASGANTYAAVVVSRQEWNRGEGRFRAVSLGAALVPYRQVSGNYEAPYEKDYKNSLGVNSVSGYGHAGGCAWTNVGVCGVPQDYLGNPSVTMKFRASSDLGGWFCGRLSHTQIAIDPFSKSNFAYAVSGQVVNVGRFAVMAYASNTSDRVKEIFAAGSGGTGNELFMGISAKEAFSTDGYSGAPFAILQDFRDVVHDTASGTSSLWSFESISENSSNPCLSERGRVLGIVTTNATAYDGVAPNFADGQLNYRVAGLHYMPDGESLTDGTYDLVMRSDVARCLYGFSKAPISATVSVIGDNGEAKAAVTTVNETADGWLQMAAYGFTFSSPRIQMKLSQEKQVVSPKPVVRTSITCVKGKVAKKVSGTAPKCPAGFKKK